MYWDGWGAARVMSQFPVPPPASVGLRPGLLPGLMTRLATWRARRRSSPVWTVAVALVVALMLLPVASLSLLAVTSTSGSWPHLIAHVLPVAAWQTLLLALGVGALTLATGTATAWLVTMYRFPGRAVLDRLLVLPLAIPTYIVAYCYVELFDYGGPVQSWIRGVGGFATARDYWFPDIRSLGGAMLVIASVLYPYVYLTARASFVQQSVCALEVARTLGQSSMGAFWRVALPLARPALVAGLALVIMETLNDLGAVQYLGVETLSASIYATWLQRSDLGGAAQLATLTLAAVIMVIGAERRSRGDEKYHHTTGRFRSIPFQDIEGWKGYAASALCALPVMTGFVAPVLVLLRHAGLHIDQALDSGFLQAAANSVMLAASVATIAVVIALLLAYAGRVAANGFVGPAVQAAGIGYAIPGTVLAIGILIPLAAFDNWIDDWARDLFGSSTGLLLSGTLFALCLALVIRFLAVALGSVAAGLERVSPNLDAAARALGETALSTMVRVHLPLLLPALGAAALLVFVDAMKELPATLLLRPFNYETLATHVYSLAALEQFETAALGALIIVVAGLVPVLLLHNAVAGGRAGATR